MTGRTTTPPWIAMYHSVDEDRDDPYQVTVTPARLDAQLRWMRARGLRGVTVRELLAATARHAARGLVGLTFDDGYADFLHQAVPLLHRHGCTATVFALPGRLGGDNAWDDLGPRKPLLTAPELRRCVDAGMEVASHGARHIDLTHADDATLREEVHDSREHLRALTGEAPDGFCYPYGTLDARVVAAVRAAGYTYGCAIDPGADLAGVLALPRVHIGQRDTAWRLTAKRRLHRLRRRAPAGLAHPAAAVS
ncbi:polysaccharide deacetylase family protein [Streptomyces sp. MUM 203J]|uniref:polysaccharide deacetylase family protein n=1 Tax=Streptomyces sp. MUM 203J TaxID=2791990 RepID=UPI001F03E725|nr:polysaccharide deacetylase family protein [Streptomyces sp. MUM 203J]MCH0543217.1 polysaccharide deacetylase family protein [Streptomyces sp. MUM 203J]